MDDFNPDQYLAEKTGSATATAGDFDPDKYLAEKEPASLGGFASNLGKDIIGNVKGVGELAKGLVTHPIDTISAIPGGIAQEAKRVGGGFVSKEAPYVHPIEGIKQAGQAMYDKPLSTGMDAAALFGLGKGAAGMMGRGAEAAEVGRAAVPALEEAAPAVEKAPSLYHATSAENASSIRSGGFKPQIGERSRGVSNAEGTWFYDDNAAAKEFSRNFKNPSIVEANLKGKIFDASGDDRGIREIAEDKNFIDKLKSQGYVGVKGDEMGATPTFIFDSSSVSPAPAPSAPTPPASGLAGKVESAIPEAMNKAKEVKDYVSRGYEGFAKKPGMTNNVADYVQHKSQMMALQQMGFTPGQGRNLGRTAMEVNDAQRAIGQYGLDSGIVGPTNGLGGMVKRNAELLNNAGEAVGKYRKLADSVGPAYAPGELKDLVQAKLGPIYQEEVLSKPMPSGKHPPVSLEKVTSHADAADLATAMNKEATVSTKMTQSPGHYTDLANTISEINNERIKTKLAPPDVAKYEQALREFGINKKIGNALKYKTSGEVKRFGPGSFTSNMVQKAMDEVGYRVGAKAANKLSTSILKNPSVAKNLPSLFKEFINHVEDEGKDITGMSQGGMVPNDVKEWVNRR